jgi:hypothetical protein
VNEVRWSRAISFGIAIFAVGLTVALIPVAWRAYHEYSETRISPVIASSELKSILSAVLAQVELDGMPPPPPPPPLPGGAPEEPLELKLKPLMLADSTITICEKEPKDLNCTHLTESDFWPAGFQPAISLRLRKELVAANRSSIPIECSASKKVKCGTTESILTLGGSWREFYARFPETSGFMRVSNAVMTQDRARALIYLEFGCGQMCASGRLVLLKRNGPEWVVEQQERLWES